MYQIVRQNNTDSYGYKIFACDTEEDLKNIDTQTCLLGSRAYIIGSQTEYILDSSSSWQLKPTSSSGTADSTLTKKIEQLTQELSTEKEKNNTLTQEKQELENQVFSLKETNKELQSKIDSLTIPKVEEQTLNIDGEFADNTVTLNKGSYKDGILTIGG